MSTETSLPSPPFVHIEGVNNFRDVGGYAVTDDPTSSIRRRFIYRSAEPSRITPAGEAALRAAGVTTVFDLRSPSEVDRTGTGPLASLPGITRIHASAFDYSPEAIAARYHDYATGGVDGFTRAYADILRRAGPALRTVLLHVRDAPDSPALLHCSAGKDRTGVAVALLLGLAGAADTSIAADYALTDVGLGSMRQVIWTHLMESPVLGGDRAKVEHMISSRADYMLGALAMIRETYGSVEGCVRTECGLTDEDIAAVRRNMRAKEAPVL